jgi:hypothetical protein
MGDAHHTEQKEIEVQWMKILIICLAVCITAVNQRKESALTHPAQRNGSWREFLMIYCKHLIESKLNICGGWWKVRQ